MTGEWKLDQLYGHLKIFFFFFFFGLQAWEVSEGFNAAGAMVDLHYGEITLSAMWEQTAGEPEGKGVQRIM